MPTLIDYTNPTGGPAMHTNAQVAECRCPACVGLACLERPNFFTGQLLTEAELNGEQAYVLAKNRLHNRYLHGWGIVCGLQVECNECAGWVTVNQGYAIDPCGNDVVVCADTPFDIVSAIAACRAKERRPPGDCDPLLPPNDPDCTDAEEHWCITLEYAETPARPLSTLRHRTRGGDCGCRGGSNCTCGGTVRAANGHSHANGMNGCGCGGAGTTAVSSTTSATAMATATAAAALGCEPTRTLEGFRLGIVREPTEDPKDDGKTPPPGSFLAAAAACRTEITDLLAKAPDVRELNREQDLYNACCNYRAIVADFFRNATTTTCALLDQLASITCPPPPGSGDIAAYKHQIGQTIQMLEQLVAFHAIDCFCLALMTPCGGDPTEQRLVLACVTIRNGRIVRICHGDGRKQLLGFPALEYAFAGQPAPVVLPLLAGLLNGSLAKLYELICCGNFGLIGLGGMFSSTAMNAKMSIATPSASMAATVLNSAGPETIMKLAPTEAPTLLDTSELVGRRLTAVEHELGERRIEYAATPVDAVPEAALAAEPLHGAVSADQPLTVYTRGNVVVGVAPADETATMRAELAALRERVAELENR